MYIYSVMVCLCVSVLKIHVPAAEEMELQVSIEWLRLGRIKRIVCTSSSAFTNRDNKVTLSAKQPLTNWTTQLGLYCNAPV